MADDKVQEKPPTPPAPPAPPAEKTPVYRVMQHIQHNRTHYIPADRPMPPSAVDYPVDKSGMLNPKLFTEKEMKALIASGAVRKE